MNLKLKHYQVRHTVSWDVLVTIDTEQFPNHSEQALKKLAERAAGLWADNIDYEQWTLTKNIAEHITELDASMALEAIEWCQASVMAIDDEGYEYTDYDI